MFVCVRALSSLRCAAAPGRRPPTHGPTPLAPPKKNKSGTVDFDEFLGLMTAKMGERDSHEEIAKAFRLFDDDGSGDVVVEWLLCVAAVSKN